MIFNKLRRITMHNERSLDTLAAALAYAIKIEAPKCAAKANPELVNAQIRGAIEYTDARIATDAPLSSYNSSVKKCYKILKKAMMFPSRDFAALYGSFTFCDDVTEGYHMTLADPKNRALLGNYMLIPRIFRKLFGIKRANAGELFWPCGVIAFCPAILRPWYRMNVRGWELLKAILLK